LTLGQGDPARGPLVPVLGVEDTLRTLTHDPRSARRRLQAAGWRDQDGDGVLDKGGATLDFHLIVNADDPMRRQAAEGIAHDLRHVGIRVLVRPLPEEEFAARLESGQFETFMGRWFPELGPGLERVWGSELANFNYGGFADGRVDTLLHQLRYELQDSRRLELLAALQARVYALQPYLFLFQEPHFAAFAARVRGVKPAVVSTFWNLPEWWVAVAGPRAGGAAERRSRRRRRRGAASWRATAGTCRPPADPT
jgi:peptide/nickel transport system substrate-binding protein